MNKRVALVNGIGAMFVLAAVCCGICAIGCVGGMEWGGDMLRGTVGCVGFGAATVVLGKIGFALAMV